MATTKPANTSHFDGLLRKLRMAEKRQSETLEDTRKQIKALEELIKASL